MTTLNAEGLQVVRGPRTILDEVSFSAGAGDFVAVVGPNGAGKSTLLSALAGLLRPDRGSVSLDGVPLSLHSRTALAMRRAYLPQNPRCEWPIPVERLVALGLTPTLPALGSLAPGDIARIRVRLEEFDLWDRRDQAATSLSGGELARAMLARAFVGDPAVLIVDEPLAGLDPRHLLDTLARLRAFAAGGKLVVASLHDMTVVSRYATRTVALHEGRVVAAGETAAVMTTEFIRSVFDVSASVLRGPSGPYVDYTGL